MRICIRSDTFVPTFWLPLIRTPESVKEILNRIHNKDTKSNDMNNDRLVSETTISDSSTKRKTKQKKSNISIMWIKD